MTYYYSRQGEKTMRYKLISRENDNANDFIRKEIASFRHRMGAIGVCERLPIPCYAIDTLTGETIAQNYNR
jgi:hypothetical protein